MMLEYWSVNGQRYMDNAVTSVVGSEDKVMFFTADYGAHHKYLSQGKVMKRYELSSDFFRVIPIKQWRITA